MRNECAVLKFLYVLLGFHNYIFEGVCEIMNRWECVNVRGHNTLNFSPPTEIVLAPFHKIKQIDIYGPLTITRPIVG